MIVVLYKKLIYNSYKYIPKTDLFQIINHKGKGLLTSVKFYKVWPLTFIKVRSEFPELEIIADYTSTRLAKIDFNGMYIYANKAYAQSYKMKQENLTGMYIQKIIGDQNWQKIKMAQDRALVFGKGSVNVDFTDTEKDIKEKQRYTFVYIKNDCYFCFMESILQNEKESFQINNQEESNETEHCKENTKEQENTFCIESSGLENTYCISKNTKVFDIVIVEDNRINQIVLSKLLEKLNYKNIGIFPDSKTFLDYFKPSTIPKVIFMDIHLPGNINGFECSRRIRYISKRVPIIIVTVDALAVDNLELSEINGHLLKPISFTELEETMKKWYKN